MTLSKRRWVAFGVTATISVVVSAALGWRNPIGMLVAAFAAGLAVALLQHDHGSTNNRA